MGTILDRSGSLEWRRLYRAGLEQYQAGFIPGKLEAEPAGIVSHRNFLYLYQLQFRHGQQATWRDDADKRTHFRWLHLFFA